MASPDSDGRSSSETKNKWAKAVDKINAERVVIDAIIEERQQKKKKKRFKKYCVKILKFGASTTGMMIINIGIMMLGGYIFQQLESENELQGCKNSRTDYYAAENATLILLMDMAQQMAGAGPLSVQEKVDKQQEYQKHIQSFALSVLDTSYDVSVVCEDMGTPDGEEYAWSFTGSLVFAVTVVTTIGYGHIAPSTMWGRLVCITYALIGIPFYLMTLANFGEILANLFKITYSTVCCCGCCRKKEEKKEPMTEKDEEYIQKAAEHWRLDPETGRPIPPAEDQMVFVEEEDDEEEEVEEEEEEEALTVPLTISFVVFFGFIFIGGISFSILEEGWTFLDAFYFSTITATTIGFGDLVPSVSLEGGKGIFKAIYVILYITVSMAAISMCFQLLMDEAVAKFQWIGEKIGLRKKEAEEEQKDGEENEDEEEETQDLESGGDKQKLT